MDPAACAIDKIRSSHSVLLISHARPDADAIGTVSGLASLCQGSGKTVQICLPGTVPPHYAFLVKTPVWVMDVDIDSAGLSSAMDQQFDLVIVVDTHARRQLPGIAEVLTAHRHKVVILDHHLAGEDDLGAVQVIDTTAAAAGELAARLCFDAGLVIDAFAASAFFAAIATDTGWFRFDSTTSETLSIAGRLIAAGARPAELYGQLFQAFGPQRYRLRAAVMNTMELLSNDTLAVMTVTCDMLSATGARRSHIENIVNEPMEIASVSVVILLVEQDDGTARCSLRSRGAVDVNTVAAHFGGGGHRCAAGVTFSTDLSTARSLLLERLEIA